ncbi:FAD-dependent oxidoreductase [Fodinibius salsisoli]|uniref:FAD-dependent oxidoreductase n=1 Tax=Fodinibius salsisoli TaxID=2820877 RepID=A0ABT3PJF3_9BACT|nr:FAD-dependent oxidoreductase [Fodinibius salsisoli]MCW9706069.1 FAD-dependent oxidoreductase [Fodinibius salsisoli]
MKRRTFLQYMGGNSLALAAAPWISFKEWEKLKEKSSIHQSSAHKADLVIAGGGMGGCAAALGALRNGQSVIMTEETDWVGGQLTQQGVPPDEHQWIETHGATRLYRQLRTEIRTYYKRYYPLTEEARKREYLNPGDGAVSRLCHEPRVALAVLQNMLAPYLSSGKLKLLLEHHITSADVQGNKVRALTATENDTGEDTILEAPYFIDATELGDLLPLTGTEYVTGAESREQTGELHAAEEADPQNQQAFTYCFAMDYVPGANNIIDKPESYDFWRTYVPGVMPAWPQELLDLTYPNPSTLKPRELGFHPEGISTADKLNLWNYRRLINRHNFRPGTYDGDITVVNWPQNDYMLGNLVDVSKEDFDKNIRQSKQLSLSLFYWLQTEVPRPDGGQGWPGLRLRPDIMGTEDGLAKYPYVRESRRIKAEFTILEEHVGRQNRAMVTGKDPSEVTAASFEDSVGIGYYHIDLHPSSGGDNYIDFGSLPFQIPLGALLPQRITNLLPANKNIGTTHITNGCYRLHPVEWSIGETAGLLATFALHNKMLPKEVRENKQKLQDFQRFIRSQGIETHWPDD